MKTTFGYIKIGEEYRIAERPSICKKLPSGCYETEEDDFGNIYLNKTDFNCDALVDLPSSEFNTVVSQVKKFLDPSTKQSFKDYGFVYKRSVLLHGEPGTGKTCIVNRVVRDVLKTNGIVLFNPTPQLISRIAEAVRKTNPDDLILMIFEEFDQTLKYNENALLSILDGEVQIDNVMHLATTNFIEDIPKRICRPGRFSKIIQVGFPNVEARTVYLTVKKAKPELLQPIVEATSGFSIDELKEVLLATHCLEEELEDVVNRIKYTKDLISELPESTDKQKKTNKSRDEMNKLAEMVEVASRMASKQQLDSGKSNKLARIAASRG